MIEWYIMNINTNTLLNAMLTKIDPSVKDKIEKLSVDGKVDLNSLVKDKGIQSLLSGLFKDIATGVKNKSEVATILENNKNTLQFKNISNDIKQIINSLKTELPQTQQLEKLTTLLKNSLVDIKTIDQQEIDLSLNPPKKVNTLLGGLVFGLGWALIGGCPGPLFALFGAGNSIYLVPIVGLILGTIGYGIIKNKLPH